MDTEQLASDFKTFDQRLARIEQKLPTLATKDDLTGFATREDLRAEVAKLATKEDLTAFATKAELRETRDELKRHTQVLIESVQSDIRLLAENVGRSLDQSATTKNELLPRLDNHELRLLVLEAGRQTPRPT